MNLKRIFQFKKPIQSYQDFWLWFQKNAKTFYKVIKNKGDFEKFFFDPLSDKLNEFKSGIYYLTGMCDDATIELIFSADGALKNMVFVEELVEVAPKIEGWVFTALKPATHLDEFSLEMEGCTFDENNLFFYANEHAEYPDEIDLTIVHSDLNGDNSSTIITGTHLFLDCFLGEWNYATVIDEISIVAKSEAKSELIPIVKLKSYLAWRQKEFVEKYEDSCCVYQEDTNHYNLYETDLKDGRMLLSLMNQDLLDWEAKASHPWLIELNIKYDGRKRYGMPSKRVQRLLNEIEDDLMEQLSSCNAVLNIGRETGDNTRAIYLACKDFRKPSKCIHQFLQQSSKLEISFDIYKDKYWRTFNRLRAAY